MLRLLLYDHQDILYDYKKMDLDIAQHILHCSSNDANFLKTVITGNESLIYGCNLQGSIKIKVQLLK